MKVKDILKLVEKEGIKADPRPEKEIKRILKEKKKEYDGLKGKQKEIFDLHTTKSPYADTRIIYGENRTFNQMWVGIDVDTSELLMVKSVCSGAAKPLVVSHHPMGRAYANFYEVMDMQSDIITGEGVTRSVAEGLTQKRKQEVARRVAAANHCKTSDAARILDIPSMSVHTPADNHVKQYLDSLFKKEKPVLLGDLIDILLEIPEYTDGAHKGTPPAILSGSKSARCGRIFVDMTGGTEGSAYLIQKLSDSGVSTAVCMHMSDKHYKKAKNANLNVIIAGHISSDNLGLNLLLDKIIKQLGSFDIKEFSGFKRVSRI